MADVKIPQVEPGIAGFQTESYSGPGEPRFGDGEAKTTIMTFTGPLTLALYSVVADDGTLATQGTPAMGLTTAPISLLAGQTTTAAVYRTGDWDMDEVVFDASFTTDAQKAAAFEGGNSPTLFMQKKQFNSDAIDV